jgi:hypothetical protein
MAAKKRKSRKIELLANRPGFWTWRLRQLRGQFLARNWQIRLISKGRGGASKVQKCKNCGLMRSIVQAW